MILPTVRCLLFAMAVVESGNDPRALGDDGHALGIYQIHRAYWRDSGVGGRWEYCRDPAYAQRVILAYWGKYCPGALHNGNIEVLARVHNGGPLGPRKRTTTRYWRRVHAMLEAEQELAVMAGGPGVGWDHPPGMERGIEWEQGNGVD